MVSSLSRNNLKQNDCRTYWSDDRFHTNTNLFGCMKLNAVKMTQISKFIHWKSFPEIGKLWWFVQFLKMCCAVSVCKYVTKQVNWQAPTGEM